jgi:hypothetical protein
MTEYEELLKYIGMDYFKVAGQIEKEFFPLLIRIFNKYDFELENYFDNIIRCVLNDNNQIVKLRFN